MTTWTSAGDALTYEPAFEDSSLDHQIRIGVSGGWLWVSCRCLPYGRHILAPRASLPAREAMAAYRQWHADHGELVRS